MTIARNDTLYFRVSAKGLRPRHVAEVGVHEPESSNVYRFIQDGVRTTLVEPEPEAVEHITKHFEGRDNVSLHECAMCDHQGELSLFKNGPSTFAGDLSESPALVNDGYVPDPADSVTVAASTFDTIDDGQIEVLSIDTEGSEWHVIKHLVSRPAVISVETHGGAYRNPFLSDIEAWMDNEGYRTWYKGKTDTVYVRNGSLNVSLFEKLQLAVMEVRLRTRRARKRLKKRKRSRPASHSVQAN